MAGPCSAILAIWIGLPRCQITRFARSALSSFAFTFSIPPDCQMLARSGNARSCQISRAARSPDRARQITARSPSTTQIKTWCNAWATSARMHEDTCLPCLFGCQDARDRMDHYIHCPFWCYLLLKLHTDPPPSPLPLTRLALMDPSIPSLLTVACSFAGYHAIKRLAHSMSFSDAPLSSSQVALCHRTFFDAFCAAALDCSLPGTAVFTLLMTIV